MRAPGIALLLLSSCADPGPGIFEGGALLLPPMLHEVSGIVSVDADTVACVQDEHGAIFHVGLRDGRVRAELPFAAPADYEGLAQVGDDWWVLRSDAALLRLRRVGSGLEVAETVLLPLPERESEGLCLDAGSGLLLIAPKTPQRGSKAARDRRLIYGFDLAKRQLLSQPVLQLSVADLVAQAGRLGADVPTREDKKGRTLPDLKLLFSEVAVDPRSHDLWLVSGVDRALLRVDRTGVLRELRVFPEAELPQPEGLAFLPDGRLLVASEGKGGPGLLRIVDRP